MSTTVLGKGHLSLRYGLLKSKTSYGNQSIRSVSLNSAIGKGLRRSKGVGFRGKDQKKEVFGEKPSGGFRDRAREIDRRVPNNRSDSPYSRPSREEWRNPQNDDFNPKRRERSHESESRFDNKSHSGPSREEWRSSQNEDFNTKRRERSHESESRFDNGNHNRSTEKWPSSTSPKRFGKPSIMDKARREADSDRRPDRSRYSPGRQAFLEKTRKPRQKYDAKTENFASSRHENYEDVQDSWSNRSKYPSGNGSRQADRRDWQDVQDYSRSERGDYGNDSKHSENGFGGSLADKRVPLSIPYTTPASEFLYGTSVVQSALSSKKEPRRKIYKLYIHAGENRENEARDTSIEQLARNNGVEVVRVNTDWLRLMDKMSGGRPHNGYILEASPLPKLPVISLGSVDVKNGPQNRPGFSIVLDHQSREEAAINGTSTFVEMRPDPSERKPIVLFLDSIQDPGNLGGIIRSASFLGVDAIAVSTRNSASFTPVVMKASAGAMEQVVVFSISKPLAFLENSKAAGWEIYGAVAPTPQRRPNDPPSITTNDLELSNTLSEKPCILMLGNEGEGLRWNLRSKADFALSIPGGGIPNAVNSLNVSVAAGILCNAFFRDRSDSKLTTKRNPGESLRPKRDLF